MIGGHGDGAPDRKPEAGCGPGATGRPAIRGGGPAARLGLGLLTAAGAILTRPALEALIRGGLLAAWRISARLRGSLDANAQRLLEPGASAAQRKALAREQIGSFARFIAEMAALNRGGNEAAGLLGRVEGTEHLDQALAAGRGLVAVTLHMGNYEFAAAALASRIPAGVAVVYDRDPGRHWEGRRDRWRKEARVDGLAIGGSPFFAIEALARLREGQAVLLAGDQVELRAGETFDFLGARAVFSLFPARLAQSSGAPIIPAFCARSPSGAWDLFLEPPIFPGDRDPRAITEDLLATYGRYLRRFPGQWLMMRPFWN